ncbi:MAG: glycoside hydrolase family 125 protein [Clostridia bacterium]|nr:glycoside hydrolase family 125 protein [Clostridia bacterium]
MEKNFSEMFKYIDSICDKLDSEELKQDFKKCYLNTLETTVKYDEEGNIFIITGDIKAMWLRDSSVQVSHYVRLAGVDKDCKELVKSLLKRQFQYICIDPYANAFNEAPNGNGHKDETETNPVVFERKYEIDSLIYPLWLLNKYYSFTNDSSVFDSLFYKTLKTIVDTLIIEQDYKDNSPYYFRRPNDEKDSLLNNGYGADYKYTGMVRSAFRPSDDRCHYPFLVPANMFIVSVFNELISILNYENIDNPDEDRIIELCQDIKTGIEKYAVIVNKEFGKIYAYELDGLGNYLFMDDANVPSLLSLPYLGWCSKNDKIYQNTRKYILSKNNPYFFEGKYAEGIGSPHTPDNYIWHISLIIEALTTDDKNEQMRIFNTLRKTTAGTGFMHEGFNCDNPDEYTRSWFAWANTLFAIFIIDCVI